MRIFGLNIVGLKRNNFKKETISTLKTALNHLMDKSLNTAQAVDKIRESVPNIPEVEHLLRFIQESKRGIARG